MMCQIKYTTHAVKYMLSLQERTGNPQGLKTRLGRQSGKLIPEL